MHIDGSDNIKTTHELVLKQFLISVNKKKGLNGQIRNKDRLIT